MANGRNSYALLLTIIFIPSQKQRQRHFIASHPLVKKSEKGSPNCKVYLTYQRLFQETIYLDLKSFWLTADLNRFKLCICLLLNLFFLIKFPDNSRVSHSMLIEGLPLGSHTSCLDNSENILMRLENKRLN